MRNLSSWQDGVRSLFREEQHRQAGRLRPLMNVVEYNVEEYIDKTPKHADFLGHPLPEQSYGQQSAEEVIQNHHKRIVAPAGPVLLFNSLLCHQGNLMSGDRTCVALTVSYCRAWVKPHMDYARAPVSLDEWYKPLEQRLYNANQG